MDTWLRAFWRLLSWIGAIERVLGVALIATIVLTITFQVFTRYFFGRPIVWVEELATYSFIWAVFLGAAVGMKELRHIRIESFVERLSPRGRALMRAALWALATFAALVVAWQALGIMEIEGRSKTMALPVELPRHLFYSLPLFVALLSIALTGVYLVLAELVNAANGRAVEAELELARRRALDDDEHVAR